MNKFCCAMVSTMALVCLGHVPSSPAADEKTPAADQVAFKMEEVSLLDQKQADGGGIVQMANMAMTPLVTAPAKEVKAYPKLNSKQPLYGTLALNPDGGKAGEALKYYFVLDQSPEAIEAAAKEAAAKQDEAKDDAKAEAKPDDKPATGQKAKKPPVKQPAAGQYDLFYIDANHDMDLSNDAVVHLMKEPPKAIAARMGIGGNTLTFDAVSVPLKEGRSVRLVPTGWINGSQGFIGFLSASARQGEISLGTKAYKATLSPMGGALGRFDHPSAQLTLTPTDGAKRRPAYGWMNTLGTIREADGEFYTLSASPAGDQLFVRPFAGDRGVLEVSAGNRDIKNLGLSGVLRLKDSMLALGDVTGFPKSDEKARVAKYRLPEGDYQAMTLSIDFGNLQVDLRANYSPVAEGKTPGTIEIRKDKPCVFDFSGKAELKFRSPPEDKVYKPGDTVPLQAMLELVDQGLLVVGLSDTSNKIGETKWQDEEGKQQVFARYASLEPEVVITDSSGKKVGGGKMPFG